MRYKVNGTKHDYYGSFFKVLISILKLKHRQTIIIECIK